MTSIRAAPRAAAALVAATLPLLTTSGCDETGRVARVAQEAADRQAAQNVEL